MDPQKVTRRPAFTMVECPFCHVEYNIRGFTNHVNRCQSHQEELLPTVGLEEEVLEREDGRFDTYLY